MKFTRLSESNQQTISIKSFKQILTCIHADFIMSHLSQIWVTRDFYYHVCVDDGEMSMTVANDWKEKQLTSHSRNDWMECFRDYVGVLQSGKNLFFS